jgi:hypothetical protein
MGIIEDELYAKFIVNAVTTVGLFLLNYFEKKYKHNTDVVDRLNDDIRF